MKRFKLFELLPAMLIGGSIGIFIGLCQSNHQKKVNLHPVRDSIIFDTLHSKIPDKI